MSSSSQKPKISGFQPPNSYKIESIRSRLGHSAQLIEQFDSMVEAYRSGMQAGANTISTLQTQIKSILANLKQAHSHPAQWLSSFEGGRGKERQAALLLESKIYQINEICHSIAADSAIIEALTLIKSNRTAEADVKTIHIPPSKREFLAFYKEACQFYRWKEQPSQKQRISKSNPELIECAVFKQQMEEMVKQQALFVKINLKFQQIQQRMLGFSLHGTRVGDLEEVDAKLQKVLTYVKDSYQTKEYDKTTPKNVKQHAEIIQILTILCNSNAGLLQEAIEKLSNPQIKAGCSRLLQNIIKNGRSVDAIYDFLIENLSEKASFKYAKSVKQLPFERKLVECEKILKQIRQNPTLIKQTNTPLKTQLNQQALQKQLALTQEFENRMLEGERQLLLAEEQIYSLETQNKRLLKQRQQLAINSQSLSQKLGSLQAQQQCNLCKILAVQQQNQMIILKNSQLMRKVQQLQSSHNQLSAVIQTKQDEVLKIRQKISSLTNQLSLVIAEKQQILNSLSTKHIKSSLHSQLFEFKVEPSVWMNNMEEMANLIEDNLSNMSNVRANSPQASPGHKRERFAIKHSRSLSNVDFLSQVMPDMIEREQCDNLSGTLDSEQLIKGIQIREKTIKKYEIYMEKQRKEAKRLRSEILDLQAKIRALQLQQIKLKQLIEDQSSEKYLQIDEEEEGCSSMINIEDCVEREEIKSIEKIAEKEVELKVKEEELNFKIEEIIKHVLKLNTLKVSSASNESENDYVVDEFVPQANPEQQRQAAE